MTYISSVERIGREAGRAEGLIDGIALALDIRFGDGAQPLIAEISQISDLAVLQQILAAVRSATSTDDVQRVYRPATTN